MSRPLLFTTLLIAAAMNLNAQNSIYDIPVETIEGEPTTLADHEGEVMLIVNVASKCGYTRQYEGLEALYEQYKDEGLVVLGFPSNQFGGQEPGSEEDIMEFCRLTYGVSFPMFAKVEVNGENKHPLYAHLTGDNSPFPGKIGWNFNKFLIGRDGKILQRYESKVEPRSEELVGDLKAALKG